MSTVICTQQNRKFNESFAFFNVRLRTLSSDEIQAPTAVDLVHRLSASWAQVNAQYQMDNLLILLHHLVKLGIDKSWRRLVSYNRFWNFPALQLVQLEECNGQ